MPITLLINSLACIAILLSEFSKLIPEMVLDQVKATEQFTYASQAWSNGTLCGYPPAAFMIALGITSSALKGGGQAAPLGSGMIGLGSTLGTITFAMMFDYWCKGEKPGLDFDTVAKSANALINFHGGYAVASLLLGTPFGVV